MARPLLTHNLSSLFRWRRVESRLLLAMAIVAIYVPGPAPRRPTVATPAFSDPKFEDSVQATAIVPTGWKPEPLKQSAKHWHQIWISPSGSTAYGIIRMKLPAPVPAEIVLHRGFLPNMKETEGKAELIEAERDPATGGLRFEARGGKYHVRAKMITQWTTAWAVYAATRSGQDPVPAELRLAEEARDRTTMGAPK